MSLGEIEQYFIDQDQTICNYHPEAQGKIAASRGSIGLHHIGRRHFGLCPGISMRSLCKFLKEMPGHRQRLCLPESQFYQGIVQRSLDSPYVTSGRLLSIMVFNNPQITRKQKSFWFAEMQQPFFFPNFYKHYAIMFINLLSILQIFIIIS